MSLINEALKKAREAQPPPPPEHTHLPLRPVEPEQKIVRGVGLLMPGILLLLALVGLFLVWQLWQRQSGPDAPTTAIEHPLRVRAHAASSAEQGGPGRARLENSQPSALNSQPSSNQTPSPSTPALNFVAAAAPTSAPATNPAAREASSPPALRLKGIVANPQRPSALINGKTLFIGERVGASKVVAIGSTTVTVVTAGVTNLLDLEN